MLDFEAGFLDICSGAERNWIAFRAGRQELNDGSGRLISIREGPNVRQSFDGFRIMSDEGAWHIDGFAVRPDFDTLGTSTNNPKPASGVYTARALFGAAFLWISITLASLEDATYNRGTADELRHTLGARLWRPPCGDGRRLGLRLRNHMAIRELWIGKYPGLGHCHGNRL
jgi:hypothetical protein